MMLVFAVLEGISQLSEAGVLVPPDIRFEVYKQLAFWDLYFDSATGGEEIFSQLWPSFVTHGFLHGGVLHLVMNGVIFLALGGMLANVLGTLRFLALFAMTAAAGALTFGVLAETNGPLVGASGAIFGFFGILKRWEWRHLRMYGGSYRRFLGTIIALVVLNVALFLFFPGGRIAWEAHLGGFVAGFLLGPVLGPRISGPSPI